jgi:hypothetical protein
MKARLAVSLAIIFLLAGCATFTSNLTHEAKYLSALSWYNDNLEAYLNAYDNAPPGLQEDWDVKISPLFILGEQALRDYKASIFSEQGSPGDARRFWLSVKEKLLRALVTAKIIKIKEA